MTRAPGRHSRTPGPRTTVITFSRVSFEIVRYLARFWRSTGDADDVNSLLWRTAMRLASASWNWVLATTSASSPVGVDTDAAGSGTSGSATARFAGPSSPTMPTGRPSIFSRSLTSDSSPRATWPARRRRFLGILDLHQLVRVRQGVFAHRHQVTDLLRAHQRAEAVLQVPLVLAELLGKLPDAVAVVLDHPVVDRRLLQRREVLALQVLDDRDLQRDVVVELLDERRDGRQPGHPRRPPATLAGHQLELVRPARPDEDGLEDAVFTDRGGQLLEGGHLELEARILGVGLDPVDRDVSNTARLAALGREEADDRRRELALLRETLRRIRAEVRPGQVRRPPSRAPGTIGLPRSCPRRW